MFATAVTVSVAATISPWFHWPAATAPATDAILRHIAHLRHFGSVGFLLLQPQDKECYSNFVRKFSRYSTSKMRDFENRVSGPSTSLEMSPFDRAHIDFLLKFYSNCSSISCRFEVFDVEKYLNLESLVRGQSRLSKVLPFDTFDIASYYCSILTLSLRRTVFLTYLTSKMP